MANKVVKLAPGTKVETPSWMIEILGQDGWPVPVFMVKGGPDSLPLGWVPKATVVGWLADAGVPARIGS